MQRQLPSDFILQSVAARFRHQEIAEFTGKSLRTVSRWMNGESTPGKSELAQMERMLAHGRKPDAAQQPADFTFIDLFAGIGGIRLGFESIGGKCVFTSEWNKFAQMTYRHNFPNDDHDIHGNIKEITEPDGDPDAHQIHERIPDHDVLLAGFPCQPFSIAGVSKKVSLGRDHGFLDKAQGTLFFDVARILKIKRPKAFLLENVKNLVSHDRGNTFYVIRNVLEEIGYHIQFRIIDARHFVPQHRERIIIVGFRKETDFNFDALRLDDIQGPLLDSIFHHASGGPDEAHACTDESGRVLAKYTLTDHLWQYLQNYAARHREKGNGFGYGLVTEKQIARTLSARYHKDGSEILVYQGENRNPRRLTPRECARLMGFPQGYRIPVSDTQAYRQFGNSVVVPVIKAVAKEMKPFIMQLKEEETNPEQMRLI